MKRNKVFDFICGRRSKYFVIIIAALLVFATTYALILPAITVESDTAYEEAGIILGEEDDLLNIQEQAEPVMSEGITEAGTDLIADRDEAQMAADTADSAEALPSEAETTGSQVYTEDDDNEIAAGTDAAADLVTGTTIENNDNTEETQTELMPAMGFEAVLKKSGEEITAEGFAYPKEEETDENDLTEAEKEAEKRETLVKVIATAEEGTFPEGTVMKVKDVAEDEEVIRAVGEAAQSEIRNMQAVDITFFDKDGNEIKPEKQIKVSIISDTVKTIKDNRKEEGAGQMILHIGDNGDTEIIDEIEDWKLEADPEDDEIIFEAEKFSIYVVVDVAEPEPVVVTKADSVDELDGKTFYLSNTLNNNTYYFLGTISDNNKIGKTGKNDMNSAAEWMFEKVEGTDNQFVIYMPGEGGARTYMCMNSSGNMSLSDTEGTHFTVEKYGNEATKFYIYYQVGNSKYGLNQFSGENGKGFAGWTGKDNGSKIELTYPPVMPDDPAGLDGKTYGLMNYKTGITGAAMMADDWKETDDSRRSAMTLNLRTNPLNKETLYVAQDSDISMWTFRSLGESSYYITTEVDGAVKFLSVTDTAVSLADSPDENCVLTVTQGTGAYKGKIRISNSDNYSPNLYSGTIANGFGSYNDSKENEWFNLAELSELKEEDFVAYTAYKVSISDTTNVPNGKQVVIYTRVWNDTDKKYDFYGIDHEGKLVPAYESGDKIEWVGLKVNNLLWDFTEYYYAGTTDPNYYYELQNNYSGKYMAPQIGEGQVLSDSTIGINLNGRRFEKYYSTILAWDDPYYEYAGYKIENGELVACPIDEAEDFYFAIMDPVHEPEPGGDITTVDTINNAEYGISMKMIDYNGTKTNQGKYDRTQTDVMGGTGDGTGLVNPYLEADGYPIATKTETSLSQLFTGATEVDKLFLESIYQQSGYFEFNSTENFAHLNEDGTFTLYNQIGTIETNNASLEHGQFMPYNDLEEGVFSERYTNLTNELDQPLSNDDPRKGESLYAIPYNPNVGEGVNNNANYHFGMEVEATFTQTADGLDAWGHDIIFEFAGDDDMWLYVDGVLVLDLGGVHAANVGKVNFRTGDVNMTRKDGKSRNTNLRVLFKESYMAQYPDASDEDAEEWLDGIFKDGGTVFKDYTSHTMKMIYMERGAGASNLHMRFNLASVKPGTVVFSKKLSGAESETNNLIEFPYQIYYRTQADGGTVLHKMGEKDGDPALVTYKDSTKAVTYKDSFTPAGGATAYEHVFFLKPGEAAVIDMPDDVIDYYIVECGIDPRVYDEVKANGIVLTGEATENPNRSDFATSAASMTERPEVDFDNHVSDQALRTLSITKQLYDSDGTGRLHYDARDGESEDKSIFSFRLYLGNENADAANLPLANMYAYHVKDRNQNYCRWDAETQKFVSLGISDYETLKASGMLREATFTTSLNGSISKIPSDYTVEIRDMIVGTQWKVEERDYEIPKGYTLRLEDGYTRIEGGQEIKHGTTPETGTVQMGEDSQIQVRNQKGWGLTINKIWTDKDFMDSHDTIYFAVYIKNGDNYTLLDDTVRALRTNESSVYYFFGNLQSGTPFENYIVYEVALTGDNIHVADDGTVTGYDSVTIIDDGGTLITGGTPIGGEHRDDYSYTVNYERGEQTTQNENVRTDEVTNSRPGIVIYKTDMQENPLAGAVFTLKDSEGHDVAAASYTSDEEGLVTIAYLNPGTYSLEEIRVPKGYTSLETPVMITVGADGSVTISEESSLYTLDENPGGGMTAKITVKNRPVEFKAVKVDAQTDETLEGIHFALYHQVKDSTTGEMRKDYYPMAGYEDLVTDENGIIPNITMELGRGTYYLTETSTLEGYDKLTDDICFTINEKGKVIVNSDGHASWLTTNADQTTGKVTYQLTVPNGKLKKVTFIKVDIADTDKVLKGAKFDLYKVIDGEREAAPLIKDLISGEDGRLAKDGTTVFELPVGIYHLIETEAPEGYNIKEDPVVVTITQNTDPNAVAYEEGTNLPAEGGKAYDETTKVYTLKISDTAGVVLPQTGGPGTKGMIFAGLGLMIAAGVLALLRRRRE